MDSVLVGREIGRARKDAGLTQAALASRLGTTQSAVARLESGRAAPSLQMLERIARATGRSITVVIEPETRLPTLAERRRRVRNALGDYVFNPWDRNPTPAEARTLEADGLTRDRFDSAGSPPQGRTRA
jgi:transcriptional regulator with XRE-family HTH domain